MRLRSSTVEPVWGTLLTFMRMKKVYTKCMADNVKSYFGRFNSGILDDIFVF